MLTTDQRGAVAELPIDEFANRIAIQLRLEATRNNQSLRINWGKKTTNSPLHWGVQGP